MRILVTGAAGFIGYHVMLRMLERGDEVIGLDNLNAYYDIRLKEARLRNWGLIRSAFVTGKGFRATSMKKVFLLKRI